MKRCLIIDDSSVIRKVARRILEGFGFTVSEAADGRQALDSCVKEMPEANGCLALRLGAHRGDRDRACGLGARAGPYRSRLAELPRLVDFECDRILGIHPSLTGMRVSNLRKRKIRMPVIVT